MVLLRANYFFVITYLIFTASSSHLIADIGADLIETAEKSVVRIEVKSDDGESLGSGFVVSSDGVLVTNCHVIAGATSATAFFANGQSAVITGTRLIDPKRDIAIAKISHPNLIPLPLAAANPRKGEAVMALGSPLGLSFTATRGIVSAIRTAPEMVRELHKSDLAGTWVQVDAALSPGNSGGPLINEEGNVVAMSTLASQGGAQNLNFGIGVIDIAEAIGSSEGKPWISLREGAARTSHSSKTDDEGSGKTAEVPTHAIQTFIKSTETDFKEYVREMSVELTRLKNDLKEMKSGSTPLPPELAVQPNIEIATSKSSGLRSNVKRYYFRNDKIKSREIARVELLIRKRQKGMEQVRGGDPENALLSLLQYGGPILEPRRRGSIGFMKEATAIAALGPEGVLIDYDGLPYVLITHSNTGIFPGQELESMPVWVGGIFKSRSQQTLPINLTILVEVPPEKIEKVVRSKSQKGPTDPTSPDDEFKDLLNGPSDDGRASSKMDKTEENGWREWKDQTGKFSIKAKFVKYFEGNVTLRKVDGNLLTVPKSKLCDSDIQFIEKQR